MSAYSSSPAAVGKVASGWNGEASHRLQLRLAWILASAVICGVAIYGAPYYVLDLAARAASPYHGSLRPSGSIGLRLGITGLCLFVLLFLYPIRKRWPWLSRIGKTKHWLDFHVLFGVSAPLVITLHSSFKLRGLAGLAYWIMVAVALSGFIGRYLYAQIPRTLTAAERSMKEMEAECARLAERLATQAVLTKEEVAPLMRLPSREEVASMSMTGALVAAVLLDLARPFRVSALRRRFMTTGRILMTIGGLFRSGNQELEEAIALVRTQAWLATKMLFLSRMHEVFHFWHVVHRPFSYSFVVLVIIHITVVILFGYY